MLVDEGLELLSDEQCWRLLSSGDVGRVAITMHALPAIFPVNYTVIDGTIVFLTSPGSKLAAATRQAVVAFEVDDYERTDRTGWSVLVVGRSEVVHDLDFTGKVAAAGLEPWADGHRTDLVRITPGFMSGRQIVHPHGRTASVADPQPAPRTGDHRSAPEKPPTAR
jgi:nitroimidazol reductase NimA-like FMN-containing flavoprotein (pyridoxamine 5'-phosphate oxidase superfamily)